MEKYDMGDRRARDDESLTTVHSILFWYMKIDGFEPSLEATL